ncbi:Uncharacterised protein [Listeria fleischmannii subsp. coloradonensis]|jgi:hypothetical protein|nr:Uncharacterised protein [Listeria fleischmannii subsp. coloradonensis]
MEVFDLHSQLVEKLKVYAKQKWLAQNQGAVFFLCCKNVERGIVFCYNIQK